MEMVGVVEGIGHEGDRGEEGGIWVLDIVLERHEEQEDEGA